MNQFSKHAVAAALLLTDRYTSTYRTYLYRTYLVLRVRQPTYLVDVIQSNVQQCQCTADVVSQIRSQQLLQRRINPCYRYF